MTRLPIVVLPGALLLALAAAPASAQDPLPPAHVSYVEGQAILEHDTTSETLEPNLPLDAGDRIKTQRGRVEVLFGDGSMLHLDDETTVDVLSDSLVRQFAGRIAVIAGSARAGRLQIDTPAGSVRVTSPSELRVGVFDEGAGPEVEVAVIRGSADLTTDRGTVSLDAGMRAVARAGEAPSQPSPFNSARLDAFDQWSFDRVALRRGTRSAGYVPPPVQSYGAVLDTYGTWNYEPSYGYVWFPRVAVGWRPYYHGRWRFYGGFGWTWVGGHPWTWPTHHYGRWGLTGGGAWFWIPGATWGPAWVHWAVAPGYVSWCPLGFRGGPVVAFHAYGSHRPYGHDRWSAWTVVPTGHFGGRRAVAGVAVDGRRFGPETVRPFVPRTAPPARPYAVARAGTGNAWRAAPGVGLQEGSRGGVAVVRGTSRASAASTAWGRDMRWSPERPDGPAAVRGSIQSVVPRQRATPAQPGMAVPGRAPGASAPSAGSPSRGARPAWTPDSVPVYRGGVLSAPSTRGAVAEPLRPGRRQAEAASVEAPGAAYPRARPRGASPSYAPRSTDAPPAVAPGSAGPRYAPRAYAPPAYGAPAYRPPARYASPGAVQPAYPTAPSPSARPGPGVRQAPSRGGAGYAVPRGGVSPTPPAGAPAGGHQSRRR